MAKQSRHTPLASRSRHGQTIRSPFHLLGDKISWSSWKDDYLPNILWACLLAGNLDRDTYLKLFRLIGGRARSRWKDLKHINLTHTALALTNYDEFKYVFEPLQDVPDARKIAATLAAIKTLPDHEHWQKFSSEKIERDSYWEVLAAGIMACLDHQSQASTDVRWLKVAYLAICGRLVFPNEEMVDELRLYPDQGEMTKVRPMIRALEMSVRMMEAGEEKPPEVSLFPVEEFWAEFYSNTKCIAAPPRNAPAEDRAALVKEITAVAEAAVDHFHASMQNTDVDPRLDGAFGIVLYNLHLALELAALPSSILSSGRIVLRSIVESCITLHYLCNKDEIALWTQYRNYGSGQSALSLLKTIDLSEAPSFVDLDALEMLANEDAWLETKDILIGAWAKKNLRELAIECGKKELYDRYYDWLSGFSHSHWGAVRDTAFTICLNPLHRLHRIPVFGHPKPSVLADVCKLLNLVLDDLNTLYPTFKPRLRWHKAAASSGKPAV